MKNKIDNDKILKECEEFHFQGSDMKQSPSEEGKEPDHIIRSKILFKHLNGNRIDNQEIRYSIYEAMKEYGEAKLKKSDQEALLKVAIEELYLLVPTEKLTNELMLRILPLIKRIDQKALAKAPIGRMITSQGIKEF